MRYHYLSACLSKEWPQPSNRGPGHQRNLHTAVLREIVRANQPGCRGSGWEWGSMKRPGASRLLIAALDNWKASSQQGCRKLLSGPSHLLAQVSLTLMLPLHLPSPRRRVYVDANNDEPLNTRQELEKCPPALLTTCLWSAKALLCQAKPQASPAQHRHNCRIATHSSALAAEQLCLEAVQGKP